jgi:hypothetical protein
MEQLGLKEPLEYQAGSEKSSTLNNLPPPLSPVTSQTSSKQNSTSIELKNIWFEMGILKW